MLGKVSFYMQKVHYWTDDIRTSRLNYRVEFNKINIYLIIYIYNVLFGS